MVNENLVKDVVKEPYKYGFVTDIETEKIEKGFRGKPVPVKVQMVVTQSSFFLLVGLSVLLIIRDTSQLLIVQRLLNQ